MADYQLQSSRLHVEAEISAIGEVGPRSGFKLYGEESLMVVTSGFNSDNSVVVKGRLGGELTWNLICSIKGTNRHLCDISKFDYIQLEVVALELNQSTKHTIFATGYFSNHLETANLVRATNENNLLLYKILNELTVIGNNIYQTNQQLSYMTDVEPEKDGEIL